MRTIVGVISDTHGLMREEALSALAGASLIIHAGDVGKPEVLDALERIAPVHAVRGNVDTGDWAGKLPATATLTVQKVRIYVLHSIADLGSELAKLGFGAVVFGHSHKPVQKLRNGVLHLNPGSAGPKRFRLPVSVARMTVEDGTVRAEVVKLDC